MIEARKSFLSKRGEPPPEVRPMRWWPLLALAAMTLHLAALSLAPMRYLPILASLGSGIWVLPALFWTAGPLRARRAEDECEAARRREAYLFALFAIGGLNLMVEPMMLAVAFLERWDATRVILAALGLLTYSFFLLPTLATLHISWSMPRDE